MEKIRIRDKHPGSATLLICFTLSNVRTYNSGSVILEFIDPDPGGRVSFETSFDSKQPKLEPKLVSALSETKCLFRLFRFYTETESFDVSIEPKQTGDQPKQFDR
jgi:hypothetical protein